LLQLGYDSEGEGDEQETQEPAVQEDPPENPPSNEKRTSHNHGGQEKSRGQGLSGLFDYGGGDEPMDDDQEADNTTSPMNENSMSPALQPDSLEQNGSKGTFNLALINSKLKRDGTASAQGTPLTLRLKNPALKLISKSVTPSGTSPLHPNSTSDAEDVQSDTDSHPGALATQPVQSISLPPAPAGECLSHIRKNVEHYTTLKEVKGLSVNDDLRDKKEFRNPGILELLMSMYNIKETGSNYPVDVFDPNGYDSRLYFDALRRQQADRERRKEETKVREFVTHNANAQTVPNRARSG